MNKKMKQTLALAGVILLAAVYAGTLLIAVIAPGSTLLKAGIGACIALPVMLYAFILAAKAMKPKKSSMIDAIIFDVGNVLVDWNWKGHMENLGYSKETIEYLGKNFIGTPLWEEFDRGVRPQADIFADLCKLHPDYVTEMRTFLDTIGDAINNRPYVNGWLSDLKEKGYELYVLSNWPEPLYDKEKDNKLSFRSYMDGCIWSCHAKCIKPEPAIYKKLIKKYNLDPARCVFIDDRQTNLDAAASFGMHTVLFKDYAYVLQQFKALGIK